MRGILNVALLSFLFHCSCMFKELEGKMELTRPVDGSAPTQAGKLLATVSTDALLLILSNHLRLPTLQSFILIRKLPIPFK